VDREIDRLAVILLHEFAKLGQRLGEGVVVVELGRALQRDLRLRAHMRGRDRGGRERQAPFENIASFHHFLPWIGTFVVARCSCRVWQRALAPPMRKST
jgi:hypothetical protein